MIDAISNLFKGPYWYVFLVLYWIPAGVGLSAFLSLYKTSPAALKKYQLAMLIPVLGAVILYYYVPRTLIDVTKAVRARRPIPARSEGIFKIMSDSI